MATNNETRVARLEAAAASVRLANVPTLVEVQYVDSDGEGNAAGEPETAYVIDPMSPLLKRLESRMKSRTAKVRVTCP